MRGPRRRRRRRWLGPLLAVLLALAPTTPAWAHGEGETTVGYELVQQALGHLAHEAGHVGMDQAMEKIDDALKTKDQAGVDVALVEQAKVALEAEDIPRARELLQRAIQVAVSGLPPATGEQTGTSVVQLPLRGRGAINGLDWVFLVGSGVLLLLGLLLAYRFRPHDSLRRLRAGLVEVELSTPHPETPR